MTFRTDWKTCNTALGGRFFADDKKLRICETTGRRTTTDDFSSNPLTTRTVLAVGRASHFAFDGYVAIAVDSLGSLGVQIRFKTETWRNRYQK